MAAYIDTTVSTMADPIYGIHQSQPRDVFSFLKSRGNQLGLVGRFSYLPTLLDQDDSGNLVGLTDGAELIISDEILYEDEILMDGQTRRYAKIKFFLAAFGSYNRTPELAAVEEEISRLGYSEMTEIQQIDTSAEFEAALGLNTPPYYDPLLFRAADVLEVRAGVPRYFGPEYSVVDAPNDGLEYVRVNNEWVASSHFIHGSVDGGTATL